MSQPVPDQARKSSVFAVPAHIANLLIGGGCGVMHIVQNGAIDCEHCFEAVKSHIFPDAPASESEPKQAVAPAEPSVQPAAEAETAPAKSSKKSAQE